MSFGRNLQYLRHLNHDMTQEALADKLNVSRQSVSKWELDTAQPEMEKAIDLCGIFNVSLDNLFREDLVTCSNGYSDLRTEIYPAFRYIKHAVVSDDPETDAIDHIYKIAKEYGVEQPQVIGWDFPCLSPEQVNIHHMHGYEAAWILPEGITPAEKPVFEQQKHRYAAIHIKNPFETPFSTIPNAYKTLMNYMRVNGLQHCEKDVIPCFETDGETMDVYIACE